MAHAMLPGTFSPLTLGHLDLIKRSAAFFETLTIGIAVNIHKTDQLFTIEEKIDMTELLVKGLPNVYVKAFVGLVTDYCSKNSISYLVRGVRSGLDYEYEYQLATANKQLSGIETVLLIADPKYRHISSTMAREIANFGHRLHGFVPEQIEDLVFTKINTLYKKT